MSFYWYITAITSSIVVFTLIFNTAFLFQSNVNRLPSYLTINFIRFFYKEKENINAKVLKVLPLWQLILENWILSWQRASKKIGFFDRNHLTSKRNWVMTLCGSNTYLIIYALLWGLSILPAQLLHVEASKSRVTRQIVCSLLLWLLLPGYKVSDGVRRFWAVYPGVAGQDNAR